MGIFNFGTPVEKGDQVFFRGDMKVSYRSLPIEATFLCEKNKDDDIIAGYKHFLENQFAFTGYKKLKPGMVTLSHGRDVVYDPFGIVKDNKEIDMKNMVTLPNLDEESNTQPRKAPQWLIDVGNAQVKKRQAQPGKQSSYNRIIWFLGAGFVMEILVIGISALLNRGGG